MVTLILVVMGDVYPLAGYPNILPYFYPLAWYPNILPYFDYNQVAMLPIFDYNPVAMDFHHFIY